MDAAHESGVCVLSGQGHSPEPRRDLLSVTSSAALSMWSNIPNKFF